MVLGFGEVIRYPFRTEDGKVELVLVMTGRILDVLHQSNLAAFKTPSPHSEGLYTLAEGIYFGLVSLSDPIDRTRFDGFIDCQLSLDAGCLALGFSTPPYLGGGFEWGRFEGSSHSGCCCKMAGVRAVLNS